MAWIINNLSTIIVGAILTVAVSAIIASMLKSKKQGKSSCSGCALHGHCGGCGK